MKDSLTVLGIDPGPHLGYAVVQAPFSIIRVGMVEVNVSTVRKCVADIIKKTSLDEVVIEQFRVRPSKAGVFSWDGVQTARLAAECESAAKAHLGGDNQKNVCWQEPSCKNFFSNELLMRITGSRTLSIHAQDALRHALYRMWFRHGMKGSREVQDLLKAYAARNDSDGC